MASPAAIDIKQIAIESAEFLFSRTQTLCVKAGTLARAHRGRVKTDPRACGWAWTLGEEEEAPATPRPR